LSKGKGFYVERIALTERSGFFVQWFRHGGNDPVAPVSFKEET